MQGRNNSFKRRNAFEFEGPEHVCRPKKPDHWSTKGLRLCHELQFWKNSAKDSFSSPKLDKNFKNWEDRRVWGKEEGEF